MSRVTIRDIAKEADVSIATVSKYLSGRTDLREKNLEAIQSAIQRLDYKVNRVARSLAQKPLKLGILLPSTFAEYFDAMVEGMREVIDSLADYKVTAVIERFSGYAEDAEVIRVLNSFLEQGVNGVILGPSRYGNFTGIIEALAKKHIPVVFVVSDIAEIPHLAYVGVDAALSGSIAADFAKFLLPPDRYAATFVGNKDIPEHRKKAEAFRQTCQDNGVRLLGIYETQDDSALAYQITTNLISANPALSLIYVATGNSVAVCKAIEDSGRGEQIKVIATDAPRELYKYVDSHMVVGILNQHLHRQGRIAVEILYRYLTENILEQTEVTLAPTLLLRSAILKKWEML